MVRVKGKKPKYPQDAKKAFIQGTVVLQATISKTGAMKNLCIVQGPVELQKAAFDAAKTWKYKPFILNGEPQEVTMPLTMIFEMQ